MVIARTRPGLQAEVQLHLPPRLDQLTRLELRKPFPSSPSGSCSCPTHNLWQSSHPPRIHATMAVNGMDITGHLKKAKSTSALPSWQSLRQGRHPRRRLAHHHGLVHRQPRHGQAHASVDRIYCCRSGSAADTQAIADIVTYYLDMYAVQSGNQSKPRSPPTSSRRSCMGTGPSLSRHHRRRLGQAERRQRLHIPLGGASSNSPGPSAVPEAPTSTATAMQPGRLAGEGKRLLNS